MPPGSFLHMKEAKPQRDRPATEFHPYVKWLMVGLGLIFVLGAWSFAAGSGYIGLVLGVVTFFTLVTLAIPLEIRRIQRNHTDGAREERAGSFREWLARDFVSRQDRMSGREAMITALLPLAAIAFGAILFAIAFQFVTHGG